MRRRTNLRNPSSGVRPQAGESKQRDRVGGAICPPAEQFLFMFLLDRTAAGVVVVPITDALDVRLAVSAVAISSPNGGLASSSEMRPAARR